MLPAACFLDVCEPAARAQLHGPGRLVARREGPAPYLGLPAHARARAVRCLSLTPCLRACLLALARARAGSSSGWPPAAARRVVLRACVAPGLCLPAQSCPNARSVWRSSRELRACPHARAVHLGRSPPKRLRPDGERFASRLLVNHVPTSLMDLGTSEARYRQ